MICSLNAPKQPKKLINAKIKPNNRTQKVKSRTKSNPDAIDFCLMTKIHIAILNPVKLITWKVEEKKNNYSRHITWNVERHFTIADTLPEKLKEILTIADTLHEMLKEVFNNSWHITWNVERSFNYSWLITWNVEKKF